MKRGTSRLMIPMSLRSSQPLKVLKSDGTPLLNALSSFSLNLLKIIIHSNRRFLALSTLRVSISSQHYASSVKYQLSIPQLSVLVFLSPRASYLRRWLFMPCHQVIVLQRSSSLQANDWMSPRHSQFWVVTSQPRRLICPVVKLCQEILSPSMLMDVVVL